MSYIGHSILNDPLYGSKKQTTEYGQYLHAKTLGFVHPMTNEVMQFDSELPTEFVEKLDELRNE
jgi:23S rRNA pseudouridine1911/1915/1917 synthase